MSARGDEGRVAPRQPSLYFHAMPDPIYLDHAATSPVRPEVLAAMQPFYGARFGNPSSTHRWGREARIALDEARERVAGCLGGNADEVCFTSGGTEGDNLAILGGWRVLKPRGRAAIVTSPIEHKAVLQAVHQAGKEGADVRLLNVDATGTVTLESARELVRDDTALCSVMWVNNEIGTIQPIADIAAAARRGGALVHVDAAQSVGKIAVNVEELGADLLSIAGHKLYAPKGVGVLYVRRGIALPPLLLGAGQERGRRPGTENVPYIVGLGEACRIAGTMLEREAKRLSGLSGDLFAALKREIPDIVLVGDPKQRLPNTLNVLFPNVSGRKVLEQCRRVMASTGSACHADSEEPSAILTALGIARDNALGAVRLSLGRGTTKENVADAAADLAAAWRSVLAAPAVAAE